MIVARNLVPEVLTDNSKATLGVHRLGRELVNSLGIGDKRLLSVDLSDTRRPTGRELELRMVQGTFGITDILYAATDTHLEHLAALGIRSVEQTRHGPDGLIARLVSGGLHGVTLDNDTGGGQELLCRVLVHDTYHTVVVEHGVALGLLHGLLERRAGTALEAVLMDEVTATDEVLLIEVVLQPDVFHVHLTIGIAHVDLSFPLTIREADTHTKIGDADTTLQVVLLMLRIDIGSIEEDTSRRLYRQLGFLLCANSDSEATSD